MSIPAHPPHADDEAANARPRYRAVVVAVGVIVVLASLHLIRTALG